MIGKASRCRTCGGRGEHVIGNYVRCLEGCDAVPKRVDPDDEKTPKLKIPVCPKCRSRDVESFGLDGFGEKLLHCLPCGCVWEPD